jgi:hypothetical protein
MAESPALAQWYLFIHQLPPRPPYLRVKVRRLLSQAGALPLKDSVYVLPLRPDRLPTLEGIAEFATGEGGDAFVWEGQFVEKARTDALIKAFREARDRDYAALVARVKEWASQLQRRSGQAPPEGRVRFRLAHARRRFEQVARNDFFSASRRAEAETALEDLESRLRPRPKSAAPKQPQAEWVGRTWVTRRGIQVDRIASAWLIRRFVDPDAHFRFIDIHEDEVRPGELSFDMMGADFTHEGDRCSFETLVRRMGLKDAALTRVAQIIHDIDIKDGKFGRPEARGVEQLVLGLLAANAEDEQRLDRGFALLDDLYRSFDRPIRARLPTEKRGTS